MLKKHHLFEGFDNFVDELLKVQLPNGSFPNGYNSYFVSNPNDMNILHTALGLIVLLEYQTINSIDKIKNKTYLISLVSLKSRQKSVRI